MLVRSRIPYVDVQAALYCAPAFARGLSIQLRSFCCVCDNSLSYSRVLLDHYKRAALFYFAKPLQNSLLFRPKSSQFAEFSRFSNSMNAPLTEGTVRFMSSSVPVATSLSLISCCIILRSIPPV